MPIYYSFKILEKSLKFVCLKLYEPCSLKNGKRLWIGIRSDPGFVNGFSHGIRRPFCAVKT